MTMSELKNCPCCGHGSDCNNRGLVDHEGNALWWVEWYVPWLPVEAVVTHRMPLPEPPKEEDDG